MLSLHLEYKNSIFAMYLTSENLINFKSCNEHNKKMLAVVRVYLYVTIGIIRASEVDNVNPLFC